MESWGPQKDYFIKNNFRVISWEDAKIKLLEKKITGGKQYHTGWLSMFGKDGNKYVTKQPKMDALWEFMREKGFDIQGFGTE